jgi:hypothetical protein
LISAGIVILVFISWFIAINSQSNVEKQIELMAQASSLINDGIYIHAVTLLEEAVMYNTELTLTAEASLKKVYIELFGSRGFRQKYVSLLEAQMGRRDAQSDIFEEAANYYLSISRLEQALDILVDGIERTECDRLFAIYEENRYAFEVGRSIYDYAAAIHGGASQVSLYGRWGIARADGILIIPCEYDKVSTYNRDRVIVKSGAEIFAVNMENNRIALLREHVLEFGNYSNDRVTLKFEDGWRRSNGEFSVGGMLFEDIGMYSYGYVAAKQDGSWGIIDLSSTWLLQPEFCEIIQDELGRSYAQNSVFVRLDGWVYLFSDGRWIDDYYEDARPFSDEGYAAVKKNGKWGFIDTNGNEKIGFIFDDALSFGQHLAAVKIEDMWGYISLFGEIVIEPVFYEAKYFSNGSAPVLTVRGWQFITLIEYKKGVSL